MSINAYKIAVQISLVENVSKGLAALAPHFTRANMDAKTLQDRLAAIGKLTLAGGALVGVGAFLTKGIEKTLDAAKDLAKATADFETLNLSSHDMAAVKAKSMEMSHRVLGTTVAGNIRLIQDLHTAFGSLEHAMPVAESFAKYETGIKAAFGAGAADGLVNAAAKALEHRGDKVTGNSAAFLDELNMMSRVQFATKGRVSSKDYFAASKTGKQAYALMDKDYLYGKGAAVMTMQGGDRFGTMMSTAFSSLIGGHMDGKAKSFLAEIGMYQEGVSKARLSLVQGAMKGMSDEEKRSYVASLGGQQILTGGLKDEYLKLFSSPDKLAEVMAEKIRDRFGKSLKDEQVMEIAKAFNKNTGDFMGMHIMSREKLAKDEAVFKRAKGFEDAYSHYTKSPDGAANALHAAFTNLKAVLGMQLLPTVINATLKLANFVDAVSGFFERNPWAAKMLMGVAVFSAAALTMGGSLLLAKAAFMGLALLNPMAIVRSVLAAFSFLRPVLTGLGFGLRIAGQAVLFLGRC
jgi:hypothetical protein